MGNRLSRKTLRASATKAVPSQAIVVVSPTQPEVEHVRKTESPVPVEKKESNLPLSAREAPPTARADGKGEETPHDFFRHCYALEEDPYTLYTQALLLKDEREFVIASKLLRSLLSNLNLSNEVNYHLAQCLMAQDPTLISCRDEVVRCLEKVLTATKTSAKSPDVHQAIIYRESLEMLAHVMISGGQFDRALELLDALQVEMDTDVSTLYNQAAYRQQRTIVSFQRAFCRYARGDFPDDISSELLRVFPSKPKKKSKQKPDQQQDEEQDAIEVSDPFNVIELLLHADAVSLHEGLAFLTVTSTCL